MRKNKKMVVYNLEDSHNCETCGWNVSSGYSIKYQRKTYDIHVPYASCYSSSYYQGDIVVDIFEQVLKLKVSTYHQTNLRQIPNLRKNEISIVYNKYDTIAKVYHGKLLIYARRYWLQNECELSKIFSHFGINVTEDYISNECDFYGYDDSEYDDWQNDWAREDNCEI